MNAKTSSRFLLFNLLSSLVACARASVFSLRRLDYRALRIVQPGDSFQQDQRQRRYVDARNFGRGRLAKSDLHEGKGLSFELGYAFALGKVCVGIKTDPRMLLPIGDNPMIEVPLRRIFREESDLIDWLASYGRGDNQSKLA
jgi:hypothetical protein